MSDRLSGFFFTRVYGPYIAARTGGVPEAELGRLSESVARTHYDVRTVEDRLLQALGLERSAEARTPLPVP